MATGLAKHHILEAIDKLRSRKSRPDVLRIVSYVSKKYEFPKNDIKEYLEKLSKDGTVLKVEFKGSISYRNAANCRTHVNRNFHVAPQEETSFKRESISDLVAGTLAQLIVQEPDYLDLGIPANALYAHIDSRQTKNLTRSQFKEILQEEVKNGNLVKFDNGNYCLGYPNGEQVTLSPTVSEISLHSPEKVKEKSKSPINIVRKNASELSRQSSPTSSKTSSTSSLVQEKVKVKKNVKRPPRTYTKHSMKGILQSVREKVGKLLDRREKDEENETTQKGDVSPVREGSRRKRFQKVVFDPSDSPKPKKMKEKDKEKDKDKEKEKEKETVVTGNLKKAKHNMKKSKDGDSSPEKSKKETASKQNVKTAAAVKEEEISLKKEESFPDEKPSLYDIEIKEEDESDNESSTSSATCKICHFEIDFKSSRASERWIRCHVCSKKAHVNCVEDSEHWTRFKLSKWQCNDCKSCVACKGKKDTKEVGLILCGLCDDAYHIKCANIKKSKDTQKWFCGKCSGVFSDDLKLENEEFESLEQTSNDSSQRTTPEPEEKKISEKEGSSKVRKLSNDNEEIDETIPDCSGWTCEEVYSYFLKVVLPEEADVFRDQEIDGRVLLLLTRYDVLTDFKLKLGPALKIYAEVKKLQVRKNDPYLYWP